MQHGAAALDFAAYRKRLKRAAALRNEIAEIAAKLAGLLRQIRDTGVDCPAEFFNIPELLRQTDNLEWNGHDFHIWRAMRGTVLGDPPRQSTPDDQPEQKAATPLMRAPPTVAFSFLKPSEVPKIDPVVAMETPCAMAGGKPLPCLHCLPPWRMWRGDSPRVRADSLARQYRAGSKTRKPNICGPSPIC